MTPGKGYQSRSEKINGRARNVSTWNDCYRRPSEWSWKSSHDDFVESALTASASRRRSLRAIEFGCGDGRNAWLLTRLFPNRTWLVDLAPAAIEALEAKAPSAVLTRIAELSVQDVCAGLTFPDGYFDVGLATLLFDHLEQPESAVDEMARVLEPAGTLVAQFSTPEDDAYELTEPPSEHGPRVIHGIPYRFFDYDDVIGLLGRRFNSIEITRHVVEDPPHPGWRETPHSHVYWLAVARRER